MDCLICFQRLQPKYLFTIECSNKKCNVFYHNYCIKKWVNKVGSLKCLNCFEELSGIKYTQNHHYNSKSKSPLSISTLKEIQLENALMTYCILNMIISFIILLFM